MSDNQEDQDHTWYTAASEVTQRFVDMPTERQVKHDSRQLAPSLPLFGHRTHADTRRGPGSLWIRALVL